MAVRTVEVPVPDILQERRAWVGSLWHFVRRNPLGAAGGGLVGLISGYVGGRTDLIIQRLMDIMQALPILVLALVMAAALGPSLTNTIIAISVVIAPRAARVVRASVLAIREFVYIESARALGVGHARVAFRHILPNTMGP